MEISRQQLDFIASIYVTVLEPRRWDAVMDRFAELLNARAAALQVVDPSCHHNHLSVASRHLRHPDMQPVTEAYLKEIWKQETPLYEKLFQSPQARFLTDWECLGYPSPEQLARHRPMRWINQNFRVHYRAATRLRESPLCNELMAIQYPVERQSPITEAELDFANLCLPHFARVVELTRLFNLLRASCGATLDALDALGMGVFIVDDQARILLDNQAGRDLLEAGDSLYRDEHGHLRARNHGDAFSQLIRQATAIAGGHDPAGGGRLRLPRANGGPDYLLTLSPFRDRRLLDEGDFRGALILVTDPQRQRPPDATGLAALYGLTQAETHVCHALLKGLNAPQIAEQRNVSVETVRSQIKSILKKTRTHDRLALFQLAISIDLPLEPVRKKKAG
jgi:DNA-binding CsgD family transcriptional regulator/PAS domain-containing protein